MSSQASLTFLRNLLVDYPAANLAVRAWDGATWKMCDCPRFTIVLAHPASVRRMFSPPKALTLCEAYIYGELDIEGDIEGFWQLMHYLFAEGLPAGRLERKRIQRELADISEEGPTLADRITPKMTGSYASLDRDRQAISSHYDVSNDFYALWLDRRMVYSCAYFHSVDQDIDTAQEQKLDYICRKLRLRPGEKLLDIGCGWGGLIRHAAEHFGVDATGITISAAQAELASERIRQAGLSSRCRVELCDYRELEGEHRFDKLVSVGMFEHVSDEMLQTYFAQAWKLLRPGGVFLNHAIAEHIGPVKPVGMTFIYLYIFPESRLQPISASLRAAEVTGFEVRDVECLREHYEQTTRVWRERLEKRAEEAREATSDFKYRVYRLYLALSTYCFVIGQPTIYQSLLAKPRDGKCGLPMTRGDWYA
jgi:cyclopropane-fatty-acyl-phospholipid synthase